MLLKVGVALMVISLVLAIGVAAVVGLRGEAPETSEIAAQSRAVVEKNAQEEEKQQRKFDPGQKLEIDDEPVEEPESKEPAPEEPVSTGSAPEEPVSRKPAHEEEAAPKAAPTPPAAPVPDWPQPTAEEVASASAPRYYQPTPDTNMTLTIEALALYDVPIISSADLAVLDRGLMHEPESSLPWDGGAGRNVFLAGHYLGWPGTASHLVFYNLDKLRSGDEVTLQDGWGRGYRYRVSESFGATPYDSWVMGQEVGRDMLTLQTCIPPTFEDRLVVRADRA
jgi:sortase A